MNLLKNISSAFTSKVENPPYKNIDGNNNAPKFEERFYESRKWVSIEKKGMDYDAAVSEGFWALFKYIQGENEAKQKIEMTAPVAVRLEPGAGPNCESSFTVSFYVPEIFQENPPKPTNPLVFVEQWQPMTVFTRRFGGFANSKTWIDEAVKLGEIVQASNKKVHESFYFTAGYDSPFRLFNRRNEVWFVEVDAKE